MNAWIDGPDLHRRHQLGPGVRPGRARAGTAYDVAVVITDGNPTYYGNPVQGPGYFTRFREMENGIFSANAIKAKDTRMIAFGVGDGVSGSANNLVAISGPTAGSDYYQTTDYAEAGAALRALALGNCVGVGLGDQTGRAEHRRGGQHRRRRAGRRLDRSPEYVATSGVTISPASGTTAAGTGAVNFTLTFPGGVTTAPVTAHRDPAEWLHPGPGERRECGLYHGCDTNAAVTVTNSRPARASACRRHRPTR